MRLDVIPNSEHSMQQAVLPLFERARAIYCSLGMEMMDFDIGSALIHSQLLPVYDANALFDARLPKGMEIQSAWQKLVELFEENKSKCLEVRPSVVAEQSEIDPLVNHLQSMGWQQHSRAVYRLERAIVSEQSQETIISARSAYSLYEALCRKAAGGNEKLAAYSMLKLDDPRYEVLVLLKDGEIAARTGVLSHGEVGLIEQVHVLSEYRGQGLGKVILNRAIELCARSMFKHVLLGCDNPQAAGLYASLGFARIGDSVEWRDPSTRA